MMLFKFIGLLLLLFVISAIVGIVRIVFHLRQIHRQVREQFGHGGGRSQSSGIDGDTLSDPQRKQRADKKIIADDEGDYIDYVEEP